MALTISIVPQGDTLDSEVAQLTTTVRQALEQRPEVDDVRPATKPAPAGAKVGVETLLGALLVAMAPVAVKGVIDIVRDILKRPGTPPVKVKVKHGEVEVDVEYSTGVISADELTRLVESLKKAGGA